MASLEELKRRNERLKNFQLAKLEQEEIGRERARLERENRAIESDLKHPGRKKVIRVLKDTGRGLGIMGRGLGNLAKRGVESYAHSQGTKAVWEKPKQVKRVKKVRKVKKKSTRKPVRRVEYYY